jgi:uncharacterized membrane protein YraQ (UPF0718 family)
MVGDFLGVDWTFLWYVVLGVGALSLASYLAWLLPPFRPLVTLLLGGIVAFLYGFRKGEKSQKKRDDAERTGGFDIFWWLRR